MALTLTTFLHRGFSDVSVSCFFSSACSSGLSSGAFFWSSPQKHMTAFLQKPGSSSFSVTQRLQTKKVWFLNKNEPNEKKKLFQLNVFVFIIHCFSTKSITDTSSLLLTFYFHFRVVLINPVVWFDVYSLLRTVPQTPTQSIQLKK